MNIWVKSSLKTKILLVFLGLSIVSLAVIGSLAFINIRGVGKYALDSSTSLGDQAVSKSTSALMTQAESYLMRLAKAQADISNALFEKVEGEVSVMAEFASYLVSGQASGSHNQRPEEIEGYPTSLVNIAPGVNTSEVSGELELWEGMDDIFVPIRDSDSNLAWVYIGTESGIIRLHPWMADFPSSYDPRQRSWYLRAAETDQIGWSDLYVDAGGQGLMITCSAPLYDKQGKLVGVIAADVTLKTINEAIINTQVGTLGYAFMIDKEGNVVARPELSAGDKRWDETFETDNYLLSDNPELGTIIQDMITGNIGIASLRFQEGDKYIAYAPITSTKWSIGIVMPVEEIIAPALATKQQIISGTDETRAGIDRKISTMRYAFIGSLAGVIVLVTGLAFLLSRTITRPILRVTNAARAIEKGEFGEEEIAGLSRSQGEDEVALLSRVFASMATQVKARENHLKKQVEELRIEIDQTKKAQEVSRITESDYFQRIQEAARKIRDKGKA